MAAELGIPVLEDVDLKKKGDLQKIEDMFYKEKARLKEQDGKGMRRMTVLVGESNKFNEVVICSTTKKYIEKLIESGGDQIKQKAKINKLSCLKIEV